MPNTGVETPRFWLVARGVLADADGRREVVHAFDVEQRVRQLADAGGQSLTEDDVESLCECVMLSYHRSQIFEANAPAESRRVQATRRMLDRLLGGSGRSRR